MKISKLPIGLIFLIAGYLTNDKPTIDTDAPTVIADTLNTYR